MRSLQLAFALVLVGLPGQRMSGPGRTAPALDAMGVGSAGSTKFTVANLGTDARLGQLGDGLFAYEVSESSEGRDLNGDGDAADRFYRAYDLRAGTLTDLDVRLTVPEATDILVAGRLAAFTSFVDGELYAFDPDAGRILGLGAEGQLEALGGGVLYASIRETLRDLNGDGDVSDAVLRGFDVARGEWIHLGYPTQPFSPVLAEGKILVQGVPEAAHGHADLNGDGDAADIVAHVFTSPTRAPVNLGLVIPSSGGSGHEPRAAGLGPGVAPLLEQGTLAFPVAEASQGGTDLNGDGDASDGVLHVYDVRSGAIRNLGLAVAVFGIQRGHVAAAVSEFGQGATDLNGDGDASDTVLFVHELATGHTWNVGAALPASGRRPSIDRGKVHLAVSEEGQGNADLNGDGDTLDVVLHAFDLVTGTLSSTKFALAEGSSPDGLDGRLFFEVSESSQGAIDLDGDGDSEDSVLHLVDVDSGDSKNLALGGLAIADETCLVLLLEEQTTDTNEDGDVLDFVWHVLGPGRPTWTSLGLTGAGADSFGFDLGFDSGVFALRVRESQQGDSDLNGDGDSEDAILHVLDLEPD